MKGTFFEQPLEYSVETTGESWLQGQKIKGSFIVRNHGGDEKNLSQMGVTLALTDSKKFKAKNEKAFSLKETVVFPKDTKLSASGEQLLEWEFSLKDDCPITEKSSSLYLLCGDTTTPFSGGHLELKIEPIEMITRYIEIFENFFRFKTKSLKNKKGFIDVQYACPGGKELGQIAKLNQQIRIVENKLEINWLFGLNKLGYKDGNVVENKEEKLIEQVLEAKQYKIFGDSPNQDGILQSINEILDQVKKRDIF